MLQQLAPKGLARRLENSLYLSLKTLPKKQRGIDKWQPLAQQHST
jgi:hypothetical protein